MSETEKDLKPYYSHNALSQMCSRIDEEDDQNLYFANRNDSEFPNTYQFNVVKREDKTNKNYGDCNTSDSRLLYRLTSIKSDNCRYASIEDQSVYPGNYQLFPLSTKRCDKEKAEYVAINNPTTLFTDGYSAGGKDSIFKTSKILTHGREPQSLDMYPLNPPGKVYGYSSKNMPKVKEITLQKGLATHVKPTNRKIPNSEPNHFSPLQDEILRINSYPANTIEKHKKWIRGGYPTRYWVYDQPNGAHS